jgi:hypothetical protein
MALFFRRNRLPAEVQQRLRISAAVAAERVLEEHARSAVELIEEGGDRAPLERLLATYVRLHHLTDADARRLREKVLATLGRDPRTAGRVSEFDAPRSPLRRVRNRLRGRVDLELREWVEQHTARVELTIVDLHVGHGMDFLRVFGDNASVQQALELYAEMLGLRPTIAEIVRLKVLKVLHDTRPGKVELFDASRRPATFPLRVADNGT